MRQVFHIQMESPSFVSPSQLEVSWESILMVPTGADLETSFGATFSSYEENVGSPGSHSRTIPRALQAQSSLCSLFLHGAEFEGIKIFPS